MANVLVNKVKLKYVFFQTKFTLYIFILTYKTK